MRSAYKVRAYPDPEQAAVLNRTFGCVRVVWNRTLATRQALYSTEHKSTSYMDTDAALTALKKTPEYEWLNEVSSVPLQQTLRHQHTAFQAFFGKRARFPRFKSRRGKQSATYTRSAFRWREGELTLAKTATPLRVVWSWPDIDPATLDPTTVTVSRDPDGRRFVTLHADVPEPAPLPTTGETVGVDLGLTDFLVLSTGERIPHPRHMDRYEKRLKRYQRILARKQRGSKNRAKAKRKVARQHAKVADARRDFLHQTSDGPDSQVRRHRGRRPRREEHGQAAVAGEVDLADRVGRVPGVPDLQGGTVRPDPGRGGPLVPEQQDLLGVRAPARIVESGDKTVVLSRLRQPARPGFERREEHQDRRRAAGGRLWRRCQTARVRPSATAGETGTLDCEVENPPPSGRGVVKQRVSSMCEMWTACPGRCHRCTPDGTRRTQLVDPVTRLDSPTPRRDSEVDATRTSTVYVGRFAVPFRRLKCRFGDRVSHHAPGGGACIPIGIFLRTPSESPRKPATVVLPAQPRGPSGTGEEPP